MDVDQIFDFNSSLGKDVTEATIPPRPNCDQAIQKLEKASSEGDLSTVQRIFDEFRSTSACEHWLTGPGSSLFFAVQNCRSAIVEYLLSQGVSLDINHIKAAILNKDEALLELFLKYGWDINKQMEWAVPPPLSLAVQNADLVTWFLSHGANPNAGCQLDLTPLSYAVQYAPFDVIKTLFDYGGSIHRGQLVHYAVRRDQPDTLEVLAYLLNKGASINDVMYQNQMDSYRLQQAFGLGTPLHEAAQRGKLEVIRFLLEKGADPNITDSLGQTAVQRAEISQHPEVADFMRRTASILPQ
ncbi:uncharacterized protein Z518_07400 [Rhinocladiella mackenziei CBS 650.93]|uniref:Rhinocladiella mackenziei CBS 650.93 unplaced genomic scaffold supercont1.5, whole genome shotgun sequence n=1 Tax=Rhinocladiella mackenziei CBS 650.93 TaxID=1442369 RepID=A0A0D2FNZ9_9EURO|nr:uncharacterized protein Z518_07400 [Rhinocladiella mackenziei CBS 650.93]KIX03847.1 hypothetical protein Z518_07400 [Rhinocladiella mackenziei CBS 650.93]